MVNKQKDMIASIKHQMRGGNGDVEILSLSEERPGKVRLFARLTIEPGGSIGHHVHEGETEMFAFVAGSGRVSDDGALRDVQAGDSMVTFPGHGHGVENTGSENLVMIAVIVLE